MKKEWTNNHSVLTYTFLNGAKFVVLFNFGLAKLFSPQGCLVTDYNVGKMRLDKFLSLVENLANANQ